MVVVMQVEFNVFSFATIVPATVLITFCFQRREKAVSIINSIKAEILGLYYQVHSLRAVSPSAKDVKSDVKILLLNLSLHIEVFCKNAIESQTAHSLWNPSYRESKKSAAHFLNDDIAQLGLFIESLEKSGMWRGKALWTVTLQCLMGRDSAASCS
jgi:hypothetical protein